MHPCLQDRNADAIADHRVVYHCGQCGGRLGVLAPIEQTRVVVKKCSDCDARIYCADAAERVEPGPSPLAGFSPSRHLPHHQRSRLRAAIAGLVREQRNGQKLALPVTATPLDERCHPLGVTLAGLVTDLTEQWIRVTLPTDRHASYWLLDFGPSGHAGCQLAVRCETAAPVGDGSWRVAGALAS
ncbi:hypothetical protein Pla123a_00690 [Posidoniimonas polymericola]|uniref:Uncharacterized protein n=1 Tax=Posidoniimonas polymericola TaxID=2528002 RepID=A0A5C5ZD64_9BACT|nr:hypothetical protein [Posidoniimonas polymericola]TWT85262.1 hypothetical protein Pla123a_00690 [Posidoniimonas polymericola]